MKKTIFMSAAAIAMAVAMSACSSNDAAKDSAAENQAGETVVAVGEVVDMPAEGTDTATIAVAEGVAVETPATADTNAGK